ncbi:hypothetical protein [Maricaulis parjimensis]|uniref:hypothetical protein n=1 Tax=Maricaulis parjimensis TaxID=144023 RepID=UPI00193A804F|nr:hypothetical protein [Maricaulis parjimensis]
MKSLLISALVAIAALLQACAPDTAGNTVAQSTSCAVYDAVLEHVSAELAGATGPLPPIIVLSDASDPAPAFPAWSDWRPTDQPTQRAGNALSDEAFIAEPEHELLACTWSRATDWQPIEARSTSGGRAWIWQGGETATLSGEHLVAFINLSRVYMAPNRSLSVVQLHINQEAVDGACWHLCMPWSESYRIERVEADAWIVTGTHRH